MTHPLHGQRFSISDGFDTLRPFWKVARIAELERAGSTQEAETLKRELHPHGAEDWAAARHTPFASPEDGSLFVHWLDSGPKWRGKDLHFQSTGRFYPFSRYHFPTWGCAVVVVGERYLHSFWHVEPWAIWSRIKAADRRPECSFEGFNNFLIDLGTRDHPVQVREGEVIGRVGRAGYCLGKHPAHIHAEIHLKGDRRCWTPWKDRPRPSDVYGRAA